MKNNDVADNNIGMNEYARTVDVIALALLLHTAAAQLVPTVNTLLCGILEYSGISDGSYLYGTLTSVISIILYCAVFFLPAFFIIHFSPIEKAKKISLSTDFPKNFPLLCIMTLGCVAAAGNVSQSILDLIGKAGIGFTQYAPEVPRGTSGIILLFISSAAVPALVEEYLFRKVILERLLPYGTFFAIAVSAAAFSLMHANPTQMLYAFTAGMLLGFITVKSGTALPAIAVHFANNALSVIYLLLQAFAPDRVFVLTVSTVDTLLKTAGLLLLVYYTKSGWFSKKEQPEEQKIIPARYLFRFFTLLYAAYTLYLSTRWVYII